MDRKISCCGVACGACAYYPEDCGGCWHIKGKVFWLEYTGEEVCDIYRCCVEEKGYDHCGRCGALPCGRYDRGDPTKSPEENAEDLRRQMELLRGLE